MRRVGLLALLALALLLVGYGCLPIFSSDMTAQDKLLGWAMICSGIVIVLHVVRKARRSVR